MGGLVQLAASPLKVYRSVCHGLGSLARQPDVSASGAIVFRKHRYLPLASFGFCHKKPLHPMLSSWRQMRAHSSTVLMRHAPQSPHGATGHTTGTMSAWLLHWTLSWRAKGSTKISSASYRHAAFIGLHVPAWKNRSNRFSWSLRRFSLTYTTVWSVAGPVSSSAVCHQLSLPQLDHSKSLRQLVFFSTS